jgi:hypothetical protein
MSGTPGMSSGTTLGGGGSSASGAAGTGATGSGKVQQGGVLFPQFLPMSSNRRCLSVQSATYWDLNTGLERGRGKVLFTILL